MARARGLAGWLVVAASAAAWAQQGAAPSPAPAADARREPTVRLRIGGQPSGGVFRPWAPLPVALELAAPATREASGRVRVVLPPPPGARVETVVYEADVTVPPGGRFLHLGIASGLPEDSQVLEARWEVDGAVAAADRIPRLVALEPEQSWVLVLGGDAAAASGLGARRAPDAGEDWKPPWIVTRARADLLPEAWAALSGADAVVLAGDPWGGERGRTPPPAPGLERALRAFVGAGGALVIAGGEEGARTAAAAGDLCPVTIAGTGPGPVQPLAGLFAPDPTEAFVPMAAGTPRRGWAPASAPDGSPLLVLADHGRGRVAWLASGLSDAPIREAATGSELLGILLRQSAGAVLRRVPAQRAPLSRGASTVSSITTGGGVTVVTMNGQTFVYNGNGLGTLPVTWPQGALEVRLTEFWSSPLEALSVPVPDSAAVGGLLVSYTAALVALLWIGRRLRRLGTAWLALGAAGVLSFGGLAAYSGSSFGAVFGGASVTVAAGALGDREVAALSSVGIYSPVGIEDRLEAPGPWEHLGPQPRLESRTYAVRPTGADAGAAATAVLVPRAPTGVRLAGLVDLGGRIEASVEWKGKRPVSVKVRNGTPHLLEAVDVSVGEQSGRWRTDLAPGEEHSVELQEVAPPRAFPRRVWAPPGAPTAGGGFANVLEALRDAAAGDGEPREDRLTLAAVASGFRVAPLFGGREIPATGPVLLLLQGQAGGPTVPTQRAVRWRPVSDGSSSATDWLLTHSSGWGTPIEEARAWQRVPGSLKRRHTALAAEPFDIALRWDFPPPRGATVVVDLGLTWEIQSE
ncbi:MAG: hypothetical protein L0216_21085, partial [Planctomycetales bacterium]|nr:hypothetical protein [Planctomycetales bacterium]